MNTPARQQPAVTVDEILAALKATRDEIGETKDEIVKLRSYGHQNRLLIWAAVIGLVLDIAASVVAGYALVSLHHEQAKERHNAATVSQLHDNTVAACEQGNVRLAGQRRALDSILTLAPPRNAAAAAYIAKAEAAVSSGWSTRKCEEIYALHSGALGRRLPCSLSSASSWPCSPGSSMAPR